ncbi:potassium channel family protein [Streptomyces griseosporeus]|uniref:potassium channel family protein n=1 Tax=Streptomyces griseosporeus TaxID=1910 RepID=UPI0037B93CAA
MDEPVAAQQQAPERTPSAPVAPAPRPGRLATAVALARAGLIAATLVAVYYLLPLDRPGQAATTALLVCGLLAVAGVFAWEVRTIVHAPNPRLKAVEALAATVALYLVLFAGTYYLLERSAAGSFSEPLTKTDALYFTLTTFTTVGFGDISARSQAARVATMFQMAGGLVVVGVAARILAQAVQTGLRRQGGQAAAPRADGNETEEPP